MATAAKFDRDEVVQKATHLFWGKGFHATSMRNLQETIDLRPGSIYASFGSKEGLFKETLQYYADESVAMLRAYDEAHDSPLQALQAFMSSVVIGQNDAPSTMCMLVKTVSELTETDNAELLSEAQQLLGRMEAEFAALLRKARQQGELGQDKDPQQLARFLQMQFMGLRAYARANDSDDAQVKALTDAIFAAFH